MTKINATILTTEEFDAKKAEVDRLIAVFELWESTELSTETQAEIQSLFDDLAKNLYAIDCAFLDAKVSVYKDIEKLMKAQI